MDLENKSKVKEKLNVSLCLLIKLKKIIQQLFRSIKQRTQSLVINSRPTVKHSITEFSLKHAYDDYAQNFRQPIRLMLPYDLQPTPV